MQIEKESLSEFYSGTVTVGTSPVQIQAASLPLRKGVHLRVSATPAGLVSIGVNAAKAGAGFIVKNGETSPLLYVDDLNKLWLVSTLADTIVTWIAF